MKFSAIKHLLPTIFILFLSCSANAQTQTADKVINAHFDHHPSEQVYVQLDNSLYSSGDTIWFKAYILQNGIPSIFSADLYVDWYDTDGKLLQKQVYPVTQGRSNGQLAIPFSYTGKNIRLLAYTKWMLNGDAQYMFHKTIAMLVPAGNDHLDAAVDKTEPQKTVLQFFPEGGNFVAGISNKVAFKATDQFGNPIHLAGNIKDGNGGIITNFETLHNGMGYFYIIPTAGSNLFAEYNTSAAVSLTTKLPAVQAAGVGLEVNLEPDSRFIVLRKKQTANITYDFAHVLATMNGTVNYLSSVRLNDADSVQFAIPTGNLSSGMLTVTVLDSNWQPLAERVTFIRNNDINNNNLKVESKKKNLGKKGLNSISIGYSDTTAADVSMSITDAHIPADTSANIISYLLLSGQLKGDVTDAAYYLADTAEQRQQELDLVMLTNGWRKYNWQAIVQKNVPATKYTRDSTYFFLQGNAFYNKSKMPQQLSFLVKGGNLFSSNSYAISKNGDFGDSTLILYDTTKITCRCDAYNGIEVNYNLLQAGFHPVYPFAIKNDAAYNIVAPFTSLPLDFYKTTLPDVIVKTHKLYESPTDSVEANYESVLIQHAEALKSTYVADKPNMLAMYGGPNGFRDFILSRLQIDIYRVPRYLVNLHYFVNEQMMPIDAFAQTPVNDIVFMKVFLHNVMAPGNSAAIFIYTKRGFTSEIATDAKDTAVKIVGYTISEEFYSPEYDKVKDKDAITDHRKTLYWNPKIGLDNKENKAIELSFYNNDIANKFRVTIEGIKADGTPLHVEKIIE